LKAKFSSYRERLDRIVIGVDPAISSHEDSDLTGIIVAGVGIDRNAYVLADLSCKLSPDGWARRVVTAYRDYEADRIVAERNQGGDLVESVIRTADPNVSFKAVHATRGKAIRAEPIAALYEQGRVFHVEPLQELEDEMVNWSPAHSTKSPDRLDALVWAMHELMIDGAFFDAGEGPVLTYSTRR
jgi:predicted phage terminase large subunit-like protein